MYYVEFWQSFRWYFDTVSGCTFHTIPPRLFFWGVLFFSSIFLVYYFFFGLFVCFWHPSLWLSVLRCFLDRILAAMMVANYLIVGNLRGYIRYKSDCIIVDGVGHIPAGKCWLSFAESCNSVSLEKHFQTTQSGVYWLWLHEKKPFTLITPFSLSLLSSFFSSSSSSFCLLIWREYKLHSIFLSPPLSK